ncbi:MAG: hypothetical protein ACYDD5_01055 [Sulfuricurvum sp.]
MPFMYIKTHLFIKYHNGWFYIPERFTDDIDLHTTYCIITNEITEYLYSILKQ